MTAPWSEPPGSAGTSSPGPAGARREIATSPLLLGHSVLVGLTPLIPVPVLDDHVRAYFERRLARAIASSRGVAVSEDDLRAIGEGPGEDLAAQMKRGALLLPVRLLVRKVFLFLNVKRASDAASATYHRGYLLDVALAAGAHPPRRSAAEVRAAIDATLAATPHSPIGAAVRLSFEGSKALVRRALSALVAALRRLGSTSQADLAETLESSKERNVFASLADRMRKSVEEVPAAYFQELETRFLERLAGRVPPVPDGE